MNDRLVKALSELVYAGKVANQKEFGDEIGYNKTYMSRIFSGEQAVSHKMASEIQTKFGISATWLLTGEGSMTGDIKLSGPKVVIPLGKHAHHKLSPEQYAEAYKDWPGVPMYNVPITASFVETYRDNPVYQPYYYLHDPRFKDCDFGAIITGDSMYAEIRHGDFVACKEITDWRFVVYGDIYYVVANNGLETCKYINADPHDQGNFLLVPRNESISPSPIPKDMISRMYKVRGIIRGY